MSSSQRTWCIKAGELMNNVSASDANAVISFPSFRSLYFGSTT